MKLFITSTGTNIGKTLVTSSIAYQLSKRNKNCKILKPIISGWNEDQNDVYEILNSQNISITEDNINDISLYRLKAALSVDIAARLENKKIIFEDLVKFCNRPSFDVIIIEGAGGIMSPVADGYTNLDLIKATSSSIMLVVGNYLGSISHTLTALEVIKYNNVILEKILISNKDDIDINSTIETIKNFTGSEITIIPKIDSVEDKWIHVPNIINYANI